jgi:hypothetical protein
MPTYAVPLNVIVFLGAFWTGLLYGIVTRDWAGSLLFITVGFVALTSARLTPRRDEGHD